jgi:HlyD family secretion protein
LEELQATSQKVAELSQQKIAAVDRLARLEIRAPQTGVIHESGVHTVGGVVGAGETLMMVVPQSEPVLSYLISPLTEQIAHAFCEQ